MNLSRGGVIFFFPGGLGLPILKDMTSRARMGPLDEDEITRTG